MKLTERDQAGPWKKDGACVGMNTSWWYPTATKVQSRREQRARKICETCPVRRDCLRHAILTREKHGIWGGRNLDERISAIRTVRRNHGSLELDEIAERVAL